VPETNGRWEFIKQAGRWARQSLAAAVRGVDVVIDPNTAPVPPGEPVPAAGAAPESIGTRIGRRALTAAQHRIGGASLAAAADGPAEEPEDGSAAAPPTLAVFPGAGAALVQAALGVRGQVLAAVEDLEQPALVLDLAWLPLEIGRHYFDQRSGGRLLAVGGYLRAALVTCAGARPSADLYCALGEDALARHLGPGAPALLLEYPERLLAALAAGKVQRALLGGEALARALALPGVALERELTAGFDLPWVPVWGLFSRGAEPLLGSLEQEHVALAPAAALPGMAALLETLPAL